MPHGVVKVAGRGNGARLDYGFFDRGAGKSTHRLQRFPPREDQEFHAVTDLALYNGP
jgi:hypothetical protein